MDLDRAELLREFKQLARGEGVNAYNVNDRVGPALRAALGIDPRSSPAEVRREVVRSLDTAVQKLPDTVQASVAAALGLSADAQLWFQSARLAVVAEATGYSTKTVRRRYIEGLELLIDVILARGAETSKEPASPFWYADAALELLLLDPGLELIETRHVVSEVAGLAEVPLAWSSSPNRATSAAPVRVDCLHGGRIVRDDASTSPGLWRGKLVFPRPLNPGQRHEFRTRVIDPGHTDRHIIVTPQRGIERLLVRVKFPDSVEGIPGRPAPVVQRLDGILSRFAEDESLVASSVEVDAVAEVAEVFRDLRPGFSYGLRWRFSRD